MAARAGLTPAQSQSMTFRDVEIVLKAQEDNWARIMELMAWMCANLMNVHIGKGRKVKVKDLLPKWHPSRKQQTQTVDLADPAAKDQMRLHNERILSERWWKSPEGRRLGAAISGKVYYGEDPDKE